MSSEESRQWNIQPSASAVATINPIRRIVDKIVPPKNHPLSHINLALGDPSVYGNLTPDARVTQAVIDVVTSNKFNGYAPAHGALDVRQAIAEFITTEATKFTADDVFVTSGASHAILIAMQLLLNPGDKILTPKPGFSLYETIAGHLGATAVLYPLLPSKSWELDLEATEQLVDDKVKAILINNPGNPTGSNYSEEHIKDIVAFARKHKLPIISDEIYANMVFFGSKFTPVSDVAGEVPVFTIGGLAKRYLIPGWRLGWLALTDRANLLTAARPHIASLTQVIVGASTVVQNAVPAILRNLDKSYYDSLNAILEEQAAAAIAACEGIEGLTTVRPQGAMYVMVHIDTTRFKDIANDQEFASKLLTEGNIMVLPGACFNAPNFIRLVYCAPAAILKDFGTRLAAFCEQHRKAE